MHYDMLLTYTPETVDLIKSSLFLKESEELIQIFSFWSQLHCISMHLLLIWGHAEISGRVPSFPVWHSSLNGNYTKNKKHTLILQCMLWQTVTHSTSSVSLLQILFSRWSIQRAFSATVKLELVLWILFCDLPPFLKKWA